jgi:SAM-dependent methyltransferase
LFAWANLHSTFNAGSARLALPENGKRPAVGGGTAPNLESFERVIELLANDARIAPYSPDWVRDNIAMAGEKNRVMRYVLGKSPSGGAPRLLDVGAQIGALAIYAAKLGCQVAAVDYGFFTNIFGKIATEQGVDYRECDVGFQPLPFADDSFDFVTYTDVIEHHTFSPKRVLKEIHRVLKPGGRLILTTPNHASIYNRLFLLTGRSVNDSFDSFFDGAAEANTYHGHHREYTRGELKAALERTDFHVLECRIIEEDLKSMFYFLRRKGSRREYFQHRQQLLVRALGYVWSPLHLPFGRILWAVGEKSIPSVGTAR